MPPSVESISRIDGLIPSFIIDLDGSEDFNQELFARQIKAIGRGAPSYDGLKEAKFVVLGMRMVIFPEKQTHLSAYSAMRSPSAMSMEEYSGDLVCAGTISFSPQGKVKPVISGYSQSLEKGLPIEASESFKQDVLKDRLAAHFTIR